MKQSVSGKIAALCFLGTCAASVFAAVDAPYEVGTWANFCKGAISHTFDDYPTSGTSNQLSSGQEAFNTKGLHMTLFVQVGSVTDWKPLKDAFAKGHEIASHNMSHDVNTGTFDDAQNAVKKNVQGEPCVSIAYPNCTCNQDAATLNVYTAARTCGTALNAASPTNFAQISSYMMGNSAGSCGNCVKDAASWNKTADDAISGNKWAVSCNHGVGSGHGWANTDVNELKKHIDYLDKSRDKIWCETFGNVARYIKERDAVTKSGSVTKKDSTDKGITITVSDNLPDSIFNYPITIRRPLPDGWTTAVVTQKDKPVNDTIVTVSSKQYVMFDAIPDGGDVVISKNLSSINQSANLNRTGFAPVIRQKSSLVIDPHQFNEANLTVSLFDLTGKLLTRQSLKAGESRIALPTGKINQSAFVAKISGGGNIWSGMFMPQM